MDVSSVGVGGGFLQNDQSVVFDYSILQATKQCSAVTENESVAKYLRNGTVCFMEIQISIQKDQSPLESIFKKPLILKASNMAMCSTHARKFFSCVLHLRFIKQTSRDIWSRA